MPKGLHYMCVSAALIANAASAAPVVRSANVRVTFASPTSCAVAADFTLDGAAQIEHRLEAFPDSRVDIASIDGAERIGTVAIVGRTRALTLRPNRGSYTLRYRVDQPDARRDRCPIWLPVVATDGRRGAVSIAVDLPPTMVPRDSMPAFTWSAAHGATTLANVPAFVRVRYGPEGEREAWGLTRMMDAVTLAFFAVVTGVWIWRTRR